MEIIKNKCQIIIRGIEVIQWWKLCRFRKCIYWYIVNMPWSDDLDDLQWQISSDFEEFEPGETSQNENLLHSRQSLFILLNTADNQKQLALI